MPHDGHPARRLKRRRSDRLVYDQEALTSTASGLQRAVKAASDWRQSAGPL
jgi:hypothetical protein